MTTTISTNKSVFVAGHRGMVGSAIVQRLREEGFDNILTVSRRELDLRDQAAVHRWFEQHRPDLVYLAAGTVGGILANSTRPAEFLYDNLLIHATVVHASYLSGVQKLLYLGSSCIYPRLASQPIAEEELLSGKLEPTNEPYAIAKIAGIKMCQSYRKQYGCNFISVMPTNLYGPGDNFDLESSHVVPGLMRRFHEAKQRGEKQVAVWGSGTPRREFLHVTDLAAACVFLMDRYNEDGHINVGTGEDLQIRELAEKIRDIVAPELELVFDCRKPDGMPRKLLNVDRLRKLGWSHQIPLDGGLSATYRWFCDNQAVASTLEL